MHGSTAPKNAMTVTAGSHACVKAQVVLFNRSFQKIVGARTNMVYYDKQYGKCHVCQESKPRAWFRCVICGVWMGSLCNPRQVPLASGLHDDDDENRFEAYEVSLHCYIWTSEVKVSTKRADLCINCCIDKILNKCFARELPILVQRRILQYVSWGSWW